MSYSAGGEKEDTLVLGTSSLGVQVPPGAPTIVSLKPIFSTKLNMGAAPDEKASRLHRDMNGFDSRGAHQFIQIKGPLAQLVRASAS